MPYSLGSGSGCYCSPFSWAPQALDGRRTNPYPTPPHPKKSFRMKAVNNMGHANKTCCSCFVWKLAIGTVKKMVCLKPYLQPRQRWLAQYASSHFFWATSSHVCSHLPWMCQNNIGSICVCGGRVGLEKLYPHRELTTCPQMRLKPFKNLFRYVPHIFPLDQWFSPSNKNSL